MSIESIHLNKLLKLLYLPDKALQTELRKDIRQEKRKEHGTEDGGGDFYQPLWSDIKKHVTGERDLTDSITERINKNQRRKRLYTLLKDGFLKLWDRGSNQNVSFLDQNPKGQYIANDGKLTIKIQNIMAISVNGQQRLGYPYWFDNPAIRDEAARIGLWVMSKALKDQDHNNMRIFDIIRSEYYSLSTHPLHGNEENLLQVHYKRIKALHDKLLPEYD